jgi:hypothetical protein
VYRASEAGTGTCRYIGSGVVDNLEFCEYRWEFQEGKLLEWEGICGRRDATRVRMGVVDRSEVTAVPLVRNVV